MPAARVASILAEFDRAQASTSHTDDPTGDRTAVRWALFVEDALGIVLTDDDIAEVARDGHPGRSAVLDRHLAP